MNELIQQLMSQLGVNADQAKGGAGLLFKMVQGKLGGDFSKITQALPAVTDLIKAAPAEDSTLNRRLASYVGRRAEVVQPIVNGKGRIRLGDTLWIVQGKDCPAGTMVTVTGVDGSELVVEFEHNPEQP